MAGNPLQARQGAVMKHEDQWPIKRDCHESNIGGGEPAAILEPARGQAQQGRHKDCDAEDDTGPAEQGGFAREGFGSPVQQCRAEQKHSDKEEGPLGPTPQGDGMRIGHHRVARGGNSVENSEILKVITEARDYDQDGGEKTGILPWCFTAQEL